MRKRIIYLDFLRGIAIILIVFGHVERGLIDSGHIFNNYQLIDDIIYSIHLPLLFILSGFVEAISGKLRNGKITYLQYLRNNFVSLYFPYLLFIYIFWFIKMFIFSGNNGVEYLDLLYLPFNGRWVFWFLLSLLLVKIFHGFFEKYVKYDFASFVFFVLIYILSIYVHYSVIMWLSYGLFYSIGYHIERKKMYEKKIVKVNSLLSCILILLSIKYFNNIDMNTKMIFIGVPISYLLIVLCKNKEFFLNIDLIGKYSMVIYLLHTIFTSLIRSLLFYFEIKNVYFHLIFGTIFSIALSIFIIVLYKNIKILSKIEYLFYPQKCIKTGNIN